ncbi:MAG: hypothetical protein KDK41_04450 [Leptospiraceae bacterium]|nr:hypothetical protein [Leptospiraceae bacterium]MCB1199872.1 hypothetical protein [Leptospiraceae bacterium]
MLIRHLGILLLASVFLVKSIGTENFLMWAVANKVFLIKMAVAAAMTVPIAFFCATRLFPAIPFLNLNETGKLWQSYLYRWSRCPKCVGWWLSCGIGAVIAFAQWQNWISTVFWAGWMAFFVSSVIITILALQHKNTDTGQT